MYFCVQWLPDRCDVPHSTIRSIFIIAHIKTSSMNANINVSQEDYETLNDAHYKYTGIDEVRLTRLVKWAVDVVCLAYRSHEE